MKNNLVANFENQMQDNIYDCAFYEERQWKKHLTFMISNTSLNWLNILSIFNYREHPTKVLRFNDWKKELNTDPCIIRGSHGIPMVVYDDSSTDCIVHDAWDINDFEQGKLYTSCSTFHTAIKNLNEKYELKHDDEFWKSFISDRLMENTFFSKRIRKENLKQFAQESLMYIVYGDNVIHMENLSSIYHENDRTKILCNIYKNIYQILCELTDKYLVIANKLGEDAEKEKSLRIALLRADRKLPQRLIDAQHKVDKDRQAYFKPYEPEDGKERSKFTDD